MSERCAKRRPGRLPAWARERSTASDSGRLFDLPMNPRRPLPSCPAIPVTEALNPHLIASTLRDRFDSGKLKLPVLPQVAQDVLAVVDDPEADTASIAELIQKDHTLAAHFLRVVNSPLYAPVEPVVSLAKAVSRLGLGGTRAIVLAVTVKHSVFSATVREDDLAEAWRRASFGGRLAQGIARVRRSDAEAAFLCGLLHGVGTPIVIQELIELCREDGIDVDDDLVRFACDALHAEVGAALVDEWNLPAFVRTAALHHERPENAMEHEELVRITGLADELAGWILNGGKEEPPAVDGNAARIGLSDDELSQMLDYAQELSETAVD